MTTRRQVLRAGLVTVAVGGAALTVRAADQGVFATGRGSAYALHDTWERTGGIEPVVAAGVLASNAHDSQPWRFRVETLAGQPAAPREVVIDVFRDPDRNIGSLDPFRREMHLSLGCAVENMVVAARARGYESQVTLLPPGGPDLVARVELQRSGGSAEPVADPLADAIPRRRTNRSVYEDAAVPTSAVDGFDAAVADLQGLRVVWVTGEELQTWRDLSADGARALTEDEEMSADSHAWQHHDWQRMQDEADGLTYDGVITDPLTLVGAKMFVDLGVSTANSVFVSTTRTQVDSAPLAGIIVADDAAVPDPTDARETWLAAGRLWQRLHLAMTAQDVATHPISTSTELMDRERVLGTEPVFGGTLRDLAGAGHEPLLSFRVGFPTAEANRTPRRPLSRVVDYA